MLTLPTGQSKDIYSQVRDAAVFVSLSADTAADQAVGVIAHSAPGHFAPVLSGPLQGPVAQLVRAHA